jgi:hypothetical protein
VAQKAPFKMRRVLTICFLLLTGIMPALAHGSFGVADWNKSKVSLYGPVDGYAPPRLSLSAPVYQSLSWRTRPLFAPGEVQLGLRTYDVSVR